MAAVKNTKTAAIRNMNKRHSTTENYFDLVVVGHISFDENIIRDRKHIINSGAAYLTSLPAALFSKKIGIVSRVGEDYPLNNLEKLGIDLTGVRVVPSGKTTRFYHKYLSEDGQERSFRAEMNVGGEIIAGDIPLQYLKSKYIHVATNLPSKQIEFIKYIREKHSKAIITIDTIEQYIDQFRDEVLKAFQMVDLVFIDKKEKSFIRDLEGKDMVIKKGGQGADYVHSGQIISSLAPKARVVDKTGAGDVLAGVFLTLMARGNNPQYSLDCAVKIASKSITKHGIDFLVEEDI